MNWLDRIKVVISRVTPSRYVKIKKAKFDQTLLNIEARVILVEMHKRSEKDKYGWVLDDCDAMLYQGLYGAVVEERNKAKQHDKPLIWMAKDVVTGKFKRRPKNNCLSTGESKSTWSRDQGLGFMWWCMRAKNLDALNSHFKYGQNHNWKMGEGVISRVFYTPQFISLLDQVRFYSRGDKYPWYKNFPYPFPKGLEGYQAHLQVLVIALYGEMYGKITRTAYNRLKEHHHREPKNPLFASVYARFKGGNVLFAARACLEPQITDYAGGKYGSVMKRIEQLFAIDYLVR